jgi:hypothetical protein
MENTDKTQPVGSAVDSGKDTNIGGDVVGRDKITINYHYDSANSANAPVDESLAADASEMPTPHPEKGFPLRFRVYHFDNCGEWVTKEKIGERFSDLILSSLLVKQLKVLYAEETPPPRLSINPVRQYAAGINWPYDEFVPFVAVTGFVEADRIGLRANIHVSFIGSKYFIEPIWSGECSVRDDPEAMRHQAKLVAEEIYSVLMSHETATGWDFEHLVIDISSNTVISK